MTTQQFAQTYLRYEADIIAVLRSHHIYDADLFQDTCLELCEYAQHNDFRNFPGIFIERYQKLRKRHGQRQIDCVNYDNAQLAALDIIDESQDVEIIDRDIDCDHEQSRNDYKDRLRQLLDYYYRHPQPGEHDHKRACQILRLHLKGYSFREIARTMKLDVSTVYKYFTRTVERLKANTL